MANYLLDNGADVRLIDAWNCDSLWYAVGTYNKRLIRRLIAKGANLNTISCQNFTCINIHPTKFSPHRMLSMFRLLVESGAQITSNNPGRLSALHTACNFGHDLLVKEILRTIPRHELDVESVSLGTPLYVAAFRGRAEIVQMLLGAGADMEREWHGESPLAVAKKVGHDTVVEVFEAEIRRRDPRNRLLMWPHWTTPGGGYQRMRLPTRLEDIPEVTEAPGVEEPWKIKRRTTHPVAGQDAAL